MPKCLKVGEQWDYCHRCGIITPLSRLVRDHELLLCDSPGCRDKVAREIHLKLVGRILTQPSKELYDRRADLYFSPSQYDVEDKI